VLWGVGPVMPSSSVAYEGGDGARLAVMLARSERQSAHDAAKAKLHKSEQVKFLNLQKSVQQKHTANAQVKLLLLAEREELESEQRQFDERKRAHAGLQAEQAHGKGGVLRSPHSTDVESPPPPPPPPPPPRVCMSEDSP
jgi:hypothetical protein